MSYDREREAAIKKITEMPIEQVVELLAFMDSMETQQKPEETNDRHDVLAG